jgi:hypothetical protein
VPAPPPLRWPKSLARETSHESLSRCRA